MQSKLKRRKFLSAGKKAIVGAAKGIGRLVRKHPLAAAAAIGTAAYLHSRNK